MNDVQRRRHERSNRVISFCQQLAEPFPPNSRGATALASLADATEQSEELDAAQSTHRRDAQQGTSRRKEFREKLRELLRAINKTTRAIGKENAAVRDKFGTSVSRLDDQSLLSVARSYLAEATPIKALFLEYDMPANFLETLSSTINDFEQAVSQQNTGAGGRTQARAGIDELQERSDDELEKLDTVMRNKFRSDPAMLAAWENARRMERAPRSAAKKGNTQ
jgi:hypothetical protein